jgi:hypothetical protein
MTAAAPATEYGVAIDNSVLRIMFVGMKIGTRNETTGFRNSQDEEEPS